MNRGGFSCIMMLGMALSMLVMIGAIYGEGLLPLRQVGHLTLI